MTGQPTGFVDVNGREIFEGSEIKGKNIEGKVKVFKVKWSKFRGKWVGDNPDEMHDVSQDIFKNYEVVG